MSEIPKTIDEIPSPAVLIDLDVLDRNLKEMQDQCNKTGTELWPHMKTHKVVEVVKRQLELGAKGITCAKLGEAESMLPSGVKRIFIAHSLVDLRKASRLKALRQQLDQLILAVTSELHFEALGKLLDAADISIDVLLAVDTGLDREGVRTPDAGNILAKKIRNHPRMNLIGLYSHEGQTYSSQSLAEVDAAVQAVNTKMLEYADAIEGERLPLYPGCTVTAYRLAGLKGVKAVRPGAYVFGDISHTDRTKIYERSQVALTVLATVVDRPRSGLALIDAGSKVFSGDKTKEGVSGELLANPEIKVAKVNEEHGYLNGSGVDNFQLGDRLRFEVTHVCPVVNLVDRMYIVRGEKVLDIWNVVGRGRSD